MMGMTSAERGLDIRPDRRGLALDFRDVVVGANATVGNHVSPVDELLRLGVAEIAKTGGQGGKSSRHIGAARQGVGKDDSGWVRVDTPIRSMPRVRIKLHRL